MGMLPKFNLARWFGNRLGTNPVRKGKRQATFLKPQLLCLEERVTPATYTVTNFGNSGTGTLRAAIDLANGTTANDTIVFDIGSSSARTINLTSTLPSIEARGTAGKLEIVGQGSATLTLNGNNGGSNRDFRIFNIAASGDFTLSGVTISGAQTSGSGAAIYNRGGIVSISDCVLTNNIAGEWGGAIRNGASENDGSELTLQRCTISNNTAADGGGISNHFGADVELYNSTLSGNTASDQGGAIYSRTTPGSANASTFTVGRSSVLKDNSAGLGGAISNRYGTLNVQGNSQIYGNNATDFGGAIYNHGTANIYNATVRDNEAGDSGGGIHNNINGVLDITDSVISGNSVLGVYGVGGGIRSTGSTGSNHSDPKVTITNSQISDNHAYGGPYGNGGGIYADAYTILTIKGGSSISNNTALYDGGGIYAIGNTILTIQGGSTISNNEAVLGVGGGIYADDNTIVTIQGSSIISNNKARGDGGGIFAMGYTILTIEGGSTISNNEAGSTNEAGLGYGGGIYADDNTIVTIQGSSIISNNKAGVYGGGIYAGGQSGKAGTGNVNVILTIQGGSTISNNTANDDGGGIFSRGLSLQVDSSIVSQNISQATNGGGGGGIYSWHKSTLTVNNSTINNNTATFGYGGGIFIDIGIGNYRNSVSSQIYYSRIEGNKATNGGGIFNNGYLLVYGSTIDSNSVIGTNSNNLTDVDGAGIFNGEGGQLSIYESTISNNLFEYQPLATTAKLLTSTSTTSAASSLKVYDPVTDTTTDVEDPFPGFTGKIHVASGDYNGDFNGDGIGDMVVGAGQGGGPVVAIIDSQTRRVITKFFAFDPAFRGGVELACLDFNLDGVMDILVGAGPGGGPHVKIFNGKDLGLLFSFYAYANDFTGGVSLCALDVNDDGIRDLVTGAGAGGAPHVKVWDGATHTLLSQWYAYDPAFRGGVNVSGGYLGSDGSVMVVTGAGAGMAPEVAVWNALTREEISRFLAYDSQFMGGVRVRVHDGNGDGVSELVTAAGPGGAPHVKGFNFPALDLAFEFFAGNPTDTEGVAVS